MAFNAIQQPRENHLMRSGPIGNRAWTLFTLIAALLLSPGFAAAASTSANLDGTIIDQSGAPIGGADIRIIHTESGTTRETESGTVGGFFQGGLRVGGPYRSEITAPGYGTETLEDIYLRPGDQSPYRIRLRPDSMAIEEMVVSAQRIQYGRDLTNGVGSSYSADDIANQPSTKRDVIRTLLRDPLAQSDRRGQPVRGRHQPALQRPVHRWLTAAGRLRPRLQHLRHRAFADQPGRDRVRFAGRLRLLGRGLRLHRRAG
ncbi:MAG: carboxypeptidase-like regulatory domain-containing protein [Gammaproteobacteria bacterium]|nr:carboxypeptidase-like regulatory domain-containing protein [Gammaproteobacteria bacterium]